MSFATPIRISRFSCIFAISLTILIIASALTKAQEDGEPITATGHGGFFDRSGKQIAPTSEFVADALAWYRNQYEPQLEAKDREELQAFEKNLLAGTDPSQQEKLILDARLLERVFSRLGDKVDIRTRVKIYALQYALEWQLPEKQDLELPQYEKRIELSPEILERLKAFELGADIQILSATVNLGQTYINECRSNGVPIPPPIGVLDQTFGTRGWKNQTEIPRLEQFIKGTKAEVLTFHSPDLPPPAQPEGMCIALPRSTRLDDNKIELDGVICLGKKPSPITGKSTACFWDNQMWDAARNRSVGFEYDTGTVIPIGLPDLAINPAGQYMAGGAEIENGTGNICTDCHAGENPYIIHPANPNPQTPIPLPTGVTLGTLQGTTLGNLRDVLNLPTFGVTRYDPLVAASWPQNGGSLSNAYVPARCQGCHLPGGPGGRLPHVSSEIRQYCATVLAQAVQAGLPHTMPQYAPGSAAADTDVLSLLGPVSSGSPAPFCSTAPTSGPSDRGEPHIVTTNGVSYDFQAAGEFTAMRNPDAGFELQTRQTPISTTFDPGTNLHTGLASCVSMNTAVAMRSGKHRITYQPGADGKASPQGMELRIDGQLAGLGPNARTLGNGTRVAPVTSGDGVDVSLLDGTRVIVTSNWWGSQGYWYLNVDVLNTPAHEGVMGHIASGEWLPRAPDGTSFGALPSALLERHFKLNQLFADAWRVDDKTSLFDYAPGMSTKDFTDAGWPPENPPCKSPLFAGHPVKPLTKHEAEKICSKVEDEVAQQECLFDVQVTGEAGFAEAHALSAFLRVRAEEELKDQK
jgi:hypothetical protein